MSPTVHDLYVQASNIGLVDQAWTPFIRSERSNELRDLQSNIRPLHATSSDPEERELGQALMDWTEWLIGYCDGSPERETAFRAFSAAHRLDTSIDRPALCARTIAVLALNGHTDDAIELMHQMPVPNDQAAANMYLQHALHLLAPAFAREEFRARLGNARLAKYANLYTTVAPIPGIPEIIAKMRDDLGDEGAQP